LHFRFEIRLKKPMKGNSSLTEFLTTSSQPIPYCPSTIGGTWHLPITVDLNQIPASTTPYVPVDGWADPRSPYPRFGKLMHAESVGNANYEAGIAELRHRTTHGLTFLASYTWAKNISNAQGTDAPSAFAGEEPYAIEIANRYNLRYNRGNVVGTPRQRFLLTGWNVSTVTQFQTGQWFTPTMILSTTNPTPI
jgi:hypothetical protein